MVCPCTGGPVHERNVATYGDTGNARRAPAAFGRLDDKDYSSR